MDAAVPKTKQQSDPPCLLCALTTTAATRTSVAVHSPRARALVDALRGGRGWLVPRPHGHPPLPFLPAVHCICIDGGDEGAAGRPLLAAPPIYRDGAAPRQGRPAVAGVPLGTCACPPPLPPLSSPSPSARPFAASRGRAGGRAARRRGGVQLSIHDLSSAVVMVAGSACGGGCGGCGGSGGCRGGICGGVGCGSGSGGGSGARLTPPAAASGGGGGGGVYRSAPPALPALHHGPHRQQRQPPLLTPARPPLAPHTLNIVFLLLPRRPRPLPPAPVIRFSASLSLTSLTSSAAVPRSICCRLWRRPRRLGARPAWP